MFIYLKLEGSCYANIELGFLFSRRYIVLNLWSFFFGKCSCFLGQERNDITNYIIVYGECSCFRELSVMFSSLFFVSVFILCSLSFSCFMSIPCAFTFVLIFLTMKGFF